MTDTRDMLEMKRRFPLAHQIVTHDYPETRDRVRLACATLRDALGANGPENIESFAERAAARIAELEAQLRAIAEAAERAQVSCEFGCPDGESVCGQCEGLLSSIASSRATLG